MAIYLNEGQLTCRPLFRYSLGLQIYLYVQLINISSLDRKPS